MKTEIEMVSVRERLAEIANRDSAVSVTVRADDLRAILAKPAAHHHAELMRLAADLANRRPLSQLYRICETQGRISSDSLHEHLDKAGDLLAGVALDIRRAVVKPQHQGEPSHWSDSEGNTITAELKAHNLALGSAPAAASRHYTRPLYSKALPSILNMSYEEAHKVDCELPAVRLTDGSEIAALRFAAPVPPPIGPILVEAVAVTRECEEDGLRLEWLLEGGIAALELPGAVLFIAHGTVTNDEGHGYVIPVEGEGDE